MKKKIYLYCIFCFVSISSFSQTKDVRKGDEAFAAKTYSIAKEYYLKAIDDAKAGNDSATAAYAMYKIAECYYEANNYERAIPCYQQAIDYKYQDTSKSMYRHYADMLMMIGDNKLAREMYEKQLSLNQSDNVSKMRLKACDFIDTAQTFETMYEVRNIQELNTRYSEFAPARCWSKRVFASSRFSKDSVIYTFTGDGFEDLYETYYNEEANTWTPAQKLNGAINSTFNDGSFTLDLKTQTAYFMQCNGVSGGEKNCNIYLSKYNDDKQAWDKPTIFQYNTTAYSSGHPSISPDGLTLYFASNNPAGQGGTDIWMCKRDTVTNTWGAPVNLGSTVNTANNEMFPYAADNNGVYFSSNGHPGYGGLDLFYAPKVGNSFGKPINLRPPFNSSADDFSLMYITDNSGIFASNRIGGVGNDDIYMFSLKEVKIEATGRVVDGANNTPIANAFVLVKNVTTEQTDTLITDNDGMYYISGMEANMQYKIFAYQTGYLNPDGKLINTQGVTQYTYLDSIHGYDMNFVLQKIEKDKEYEIRDIYYDLDKYELRPASVEELNKLVAVLNNNPDICIQINSHTDERASDTYNIILSNNRAKSVVDYLHSQGIDDKRLTWKGWGETKPIFKNAQSEDEHQANRRTTFSIVNFEELELSKKAEEHKSTIDRLESNGKQAPRQQGICFRLQIGASKAKCNNKTFAKLTGEYAKLPTYCSKESDGLYRYTVGSFTSFQEATKMKDEIDKLGYNSFIVAYENGKRIQINEALRKIQQTEKK